MNNIQFRLLGEWVNQKYERYLPSAFDDSLSMLEKINKLIEFLNEVIRNYNGFGSEIEATVNGQNVKIQQLIDDVDAFKELVTSQLIPENLEILLETWYQEGRLADIINEALYDEIDTRYNELEEKFSDVLKLSDFKIQLPETDDTERLQRAFNASRLQQKVLVNYDHSLTVFISKPLYIDGGEGFILNGMKIVKTTNVKGVGFNTYRNGLVTDVYSVDASIIVRHEDEKDTLFVEMNGLLLSSTAEQKHEYGIYAPRLARSSLENIRTDYNHYDCAVFGYTWWLIHRLHNIRNDEGRITWEIADDGTGIGQSTSIMASHIVGTDQDSCLSVFGASYIVVNNPVIDRCNGIAFKFMSCRGVTINSPSVEYLLSGQFIQVSDSNVVMNTPNCVEISGNHNTPRILLDVRDSGVLQVNAGRFSDYITSVNENDYPVTSVGNSSCFLNQTKLPTNGNNFRGLSDGATITVNDKEGFYTLKPFGEASSYQSDTITRVLYGNTLPTTGVFKQGDVFRYLGERYGLPVEYTYMDGKGWVWSKSYTEKLPTYGRPSPLSPKERGLIYLDDLLNLPIIWDGEKWIDFNGNAV